MFIPEIVSICLTAKKNSYCDYSVLKYIGIELSKIQETYIQKKT